MAGLSLARRLGPAGPVVIVGGQSFLLCLQQNRDDLLRLGGWLHASDPRQGIRIGAVKFLEVLVVVAKIGPAQIREFSRLDYGLQRGLTLGAELLRRGGGFRGRF